MAKKKLARFAEMETFRHVIQPSFQEVFKKKYKLNGQWNLQFFKNSNPIILELGCGKGEYTVGLARLFPDKNFIGVDIKGSRMWKGAKSVLDEKLNNVGFIRTRIDFIHSFFKTDEVDEIWITFPDPQPKKAYKRLTSSRFLSYYQEFLKNDGIVHLKTDNDDLYRYTKELVVLNDLEIVSDYDNLYNKITEDPVLSIKTFYERSFLELNKRIHYLNFKLKKDKNLEEPEE